MTLPPDDDAPSRDITRKDFLNATLLGAGAMLLGAAAPAEALARRAAGSEAAPATDPWTGPGGVGDYATSNGNTRAVMDAAHRVRDGGYASSRSHAARASETYDLVVVGGGITGLTAAHFYAKGTAGQRRCLVLENHPIFGGEAKQNEFDVNGVRLIAPQGSNDFGIPRAGGGWQSELWDELHMPRELTHAEWGSSLPPLRLAQDNYQPMEGVGEYGVDIGYRFEPGAGQAEGRWLRNIWQNDLADAPFSDEVKRDLLKWRSTNPQTNGLGGEAYGRWLDTMTYRDYLEKVMGYGPAVTRMIEPVVGLINGASPDAVSAHAAQQIGMPGVSRARGRTGGAGLSFPGGNVTYARHLVKALVPGGIEGEATFDGILAGRVRWNALDAPNGPTRIRSGATVVRVEHDGDPATANSVTVTYVKDGHLHAVKARHVAMASGGWITKRIVAGLPEDIVAAYGEFQYAPALVINVALTNWRFMYKLGITAARWFDEHGLGFVANIRRPMTTASYQPPLDPDKPTVLTFYMGLYTPGRPAYEQGVLNRARLFATPYAEYERTLRAQLTRQFATAGFDARRDIAGIILNRWGHARLVQPPGWYYGRDGKPAPREVVARGFGRVAIGHSELNGHQSATGAMAQGKRLGEWAVSAR